MKKKKKIIIILAAVIVVAIVIVANVLKSGEKSYQVQAEKVERGDLTSIVTANGKIVPKTDVKISAYVPAKITKLPVEEGDEVKKGQLLVQLDDTEYRAAVNRSRAELASAKASLEQAQLVFNRQNELFAKKLSSEEKYDMAKTDLDLAKARHQQAEASLDQAKYNLSKTTMTSPMDGIVTSLNAEVGEIVMIGTMNNPGTVIMTVSDMSEIETEVEVDETDIAQVELGQETEISIDAYPDTAFKGKVTEIGHTARVSGLGTQDQVTNFLVKVMLIDEVPTIRPGMSASVDITTDSRSDVLNVPIQAVVMREEKSDTLVSEEKEKEGAVASTDSGSTKGEKKSKKEKKEVEGIFLVAEGRAKFVKVATGIADQQNIEIVSGINEDDKVVTGSYKILRTLKDGDKVKVTEKKGEGNENK
ncbi:MAG: efflux RND transporter periplasmic adaptor subunit [Candidatus Zixiibacteriota bacterium]|nr:MAG: efflux RND transporter periplasmic adaptor subunit [candidate division Zixibacteria bacterium]